MRRRTLAFGITLCCLLSPGRVLAQQVPADGAQSDVLAITGQVDVIESGSTRRDSGQARSDPCDRQGVPASLSSVNSAMAQPSNSVRV